VTELSLSIPAYGRRAFSVVGPMTWNSLPRHLRDPIYTISVFEGLLKIFFQSTNVCSALEAFGVDAVYKFTYFFTYSRFAALAGGGLA